MPRGSANGQRAGMLARLESYKALRDGGASTFDAANQMGIGDTTRLVYERWYREATGLPRREQGRQRATGEPRGGTW